MIMQMLGFLNLSFIDILDIVLVAIIIYLVFLWMRRSSAFNIFISIIIVVMVRVSAQALGLKMISSIIGTIIDVGVIALIIIFQPELRRFLNNLGRTAGSTLENHTILKRIFPGLKGEEVDNSAVSEIAEACMEMGAKKTGALILIRKNSNLDEIISTGDIVDAQISCRLIMNIFFKNSPLHDGAMIIGSGRIIAARCTLPITDRTDLPASFGMRHRAAVGVSEVCDADVIVVSEETGGISYVHNGKVTPVDSSNRLILLLSDKGE